MSRIIVVGSANVDYTLRVERLPRPGETVLGKDYQRSFGGKGANQALAARLAGADVRFIAKIGGDEMGRLIERHLAASGLPTDHLLHDSTGASGMALILVDQQGGNQIAVAPGSNAALSPEDVRRGLTGLRPGDLVLTQLEIPIAAVEEALILAKGHRATTVLNPAPVRRLSEEVLSRVDLLIPNETEATALTDLSDPEQAGRALVSRGVHTVIVTLGEKGALLCRKGMTRHFPALPAPTVDTTAAGDAFAGVLAAMLSEGKTIYEAIHLANAAGALATSKCGAQESLPRRKEIEELGRSSR
jgi:ribokinase